MAYSIDRMPERISIGRETETGVTDVMIDCGAWVSKWPGMTLHAIHTPDGGTPYILQTETVGSVLVWHVTDADTAKPGTGRMEIVGEMDGRRKVSAMVKVSVAARMGGTVGEPPEAAKPWVESVIGAADRITGMKAQAETLDAGSGATAAWDGQQGLLTIGVPKGEKGEKGEPGKDAVVDATLTQSGQAADAKATGESVGQLKDDLSDIKNATDNPVSAGKVWTSMHTGAGWADPQSGGSGGSISKILTDLVDYMVAEDLAEINLYQLIGDAWLTKFDRLEFKIESYGISGNKINLNLWCSSEQCYMNIHGGGASYTVVEEGFAPDGYGNVVLTTYRRDGSGNDTLPFESVHRVQPKYIYNKYRKFPVGGDTSYSKLYGTIKAGTKIVIKGVPHNV